MPGPVDGAARLRWSGLFVDGERRVRHGWWVAIFFIVLASLLIPALLVADGLGVEVSIVQQAGLIAVASSVCQLLRRRPMAEVTGRLDGRWLKQLMVGGAIGSALMFVPALVLLVGGWVTWQQDSLDASALLPSLAVFAGVALAEELLFRGFVFQRLVAALGQWPAQLLVAGFFLLTHVNNPGMAGGVRVLASVNIFLASIMFGVAYIRTRSLAMPVGLHLGANWMQGGVLGFGVSGERQRGLLEPVIVSGPEWFTGGTFGLEASVPGLALVVLALVLLGRWKPRAAAAWVPGRREDDPGGSREHERGGG